MRRTHGCRGDTTPPCIEPTVGKVAEDIEETGADEVGDVLDEDERRLFLLLGDAVDDVAEPGPPPSLVVGATLSSGDAVSLAGESAGDEVDVGAGLCGPPGGSGSDVVMLRHLRPVLVEHAAAIAVDLDLADRRHAGPFQAEVEAADAAEEG
jgi:hypothetical protein